MNDTVDTPDFEMKHRLLGAAILISLGVLILPWLLGSYSVNADGSMKDGAIAINDASTVDSVNKNGTAVLGDGSQSVSNNSIQIPADEDIKVFVSKIKPVDSSGRKVTEPKVDEAKTSSVDKPKAQVADKPTTTKTAVTETAKTNSDKKEAKPVASKSATPDKVVAKPKLDADEKPQIKQGYIVSVGVYLKRAGADSVMQDLRNKGFQPSSSKINTSKGVATRVWLGPYSTRAKAGKERSKLERIVGEPGLIKSYP